MTLNTDELAEALQENFKLRRELQRGGRSQGRKTCRCPYSIRRESSACSYAFFWRNRRASVSATVVELMTLDGARKQYVAQLRQLDREALLKEFEQLRRLLSDLTPPARGVLRVHGLAYSPATGMIGATDISISACDGESVGL